MQELSNELYIRIFQYLSKRDIKQCLNVCKRWYLLLGSTYYQEVYVLENEMKSFLLFIQHSAHVDYLTLWIKKLIITKSYTEPKYLTTKEYHQLLSLLRNLERIYIHQSVNSIWHLEHLSTIDTQRVKNIKEIKLLNSTRLHYNENNRYLDERMSYWYTVNTVKLCRTITHLEMNSFSVGYFTYESRQQRFINYLDHFKQLTHLKIENLIASGIPHLSLLTVLDQCPKLQSFDFLSEYPQEEDNSNLIMPSKVNRKLEKFGLQLPSLPIAYIHYLIHYIPIHIQHFSIITTCSFLPNWTQHSNTMEQFNDLLSRTKTLTLQMKGNNLWHETQLDIPATPTYIHQFWANVDRIKHGRPMRMHVNISLDHFIAFPETSIHLENHHMMRLGMTFMDPYSYSRRSDTDLVRFLGLKDQLHEMHSFVLKERGEACLITSQLAPLLAYLMRAAKTLKYINIKSEPFAATLFDHNSFIPNQSTSLLLSPTVWDKTTNAFFMSAVHERLDWLNEHALIKCGILEDIYVTEELVEVLASPPIQLENLKLQRCRYKKDSNNNIHLCWKSCKLEELVMKMNRADTDTTKTFGVYIKCQDLEKRYWNRGRRLVLCEDLDEFNALYLEPSAMIITIECVSLASYQLEVREQHLLCTIYPMN